MGIRYAPVPGFFAGALSGLLSCGIYYLDYHDLGRVPFASILFSTVLLGCILDMLSDGMSNKAMRITGEKQYFRVFFKMAVVCVLASAPLGAFAGYQVTKDCFEGVAAGHSPQSACQIYFDQVTVLIISAVMGLMVLGHRMLFCAQVSFRRVELYLPVFATSAAFSVVVGWLPLTFIDFFSIFFDIYNPNVSPLTVAIGSAAMTSIGAFAFCLFFALSAYGLRGRYLAAD